MSINKQRSEFERTARENGDINRDLRETSFGENFEAAFFQSMSEDLSISQYINEAEKRGQEETLRKRIIDGDIDQQILESNTGKPVGRMRDRRVNYGKLADDLVAAGDPSLMTREQIADNMKGNADAIRKRYQDISSRASMAGTSGSFIGSVASGFVDPPTLVAGMVLPASSVTAATLKMRVAQRAITGAKQGAVVEPVLQAQVANWKQEIDVEYGLKDMAINAGVGIVASGVLAGTLGSVGDATGALRRRLDEARGIRTEAESRGQEDITEAADDMIDGTEQMIRELENSPATTLDEHDMAVNKAVESFDQSPFTDLDEWHNEELPLWLTDDVESIDGSIPEATQEAAAAKADEPETEQPTEIAPIIPLSSTVNANTKKAYEVIEASKNSNDPQTQQMAKEFIAKTKSTENMIQKAKKFADCVRS